MRDRFHYGKCLTYPKRRRSREKPSPGPVTRGGGVPHLPRTCLLLPGGWRPPRATHTIAGAMKAVFLHFPASFTRGRNSSHLRSRCPGRIQSPPPQRPLLGTVPVPPPGRSPRTSGSGPSILAPSAWG